MKTFFSAGKETPLRGACTGRCTGEWTIIPDETAASSVCLGTTSYYSALGRPEAVSIVLDGEPFVGIRQVSGMPPFLMSVVSNSDVWLFLGSNSGFAAGRKDPDHALFPYRTADKILCDSASGGVRSILLVGRGEGWALWEPWQGNGGAYEIVRNLYKDRFGTAVVFQEINHSLGLCFSWRLTTSERFGLVRFCTLENRSADKICVRYLDGWKHLIPPGVSQELYSRFSYLAAAYMRHECVQGLGIYTLNSGISDRPEPCESLYAACAWSLGHAHPTMLLSERQVEAFRQGEPICAESEVRGNFGAYLIGDSIELGPGEREDWMIVADTGLDHSTLASLRTGLSHPDALAQAVKDDVVATREGLKRRIAAADGLQQTADSAASTHHFANVLFNCMRGGILADSYRVPAADFAAFLKLRNTQVHARQAGWLAQLPAQLDLDTLQRKAAETRDPQLLRLAREYLPLTFSRRHGDPSRPWNRFTIRTRDESGGVLYDYQGNWRDIFQNWESLAQSYPACLGSMLSIFLNASTADGYNPYRITRAGIDWEVENPDDPWSHIGYWGDHQINYLLRLLESHERFQPGKLAGILNERLFSCANVPYEIRSFENLVRDPRHSIRFDAALHKRLLARAKELGNDGKLCADKAGEVLLMSLADKLLIPLLTKLSNFVPGGGIWLNTQRPEWNDANNALAGWGMSVVTVCYLRRYLAFLDRLFASTQSVDLSVPVTAFAERLCEILSKAECKHDAARFELVAALGRAGQQYRQEVYQGKLDQRATASVANIRRLLEVALLAVESTLRASRRADGMFHSYNLLKITENRAVVENMYLMLEGQVAALSSGLLKPIEALSLLEALRRSALFRADQHSYLLYPEREVPAFFARNTLPREWREKVPALASLVAGGPSPGTVPGVLAVDVNGEAHFHADLTNTAGLETRLEQLATNERWRDAVRQDCPALLNLWERVFHHAAFTGRSGTMFAFEGLGSIYWHMVAKLLVATEECFQDAVDGQADADVINGLRAAYHDIRRGLGFTKTPEVYGAFPTDPYSHSPKHLGAQQPGMTGQVKEEILTRWAELGVRVINGTLTFAPRLLRRAEFAADAQVFSYVELDGSERSWELPPGRLAFTYCQVPICYELADAPSLTVERRNGGHETRPSNALFHAESDEIFARTGAITKLKVSVPRNDLFE